jgi:hypothetical protein
MVLNNVGRYVVFLKLEQCGLGCSSVVERLPSMHKALGLIPALKN